MPAVTPSSPWRAIRTAVWLFFNTTQLLASLLTLAGLAVVGSIAARLADFSGLVVPAVAFAVGVTATIVVGSLEVARPAGPRRWLIQGYRWASADYHYQLSNRVEHVQDVRIEVQAVRTGIDHFENRYQMTASAGGQPVIVSPGHSLLGTLRRGAWVFYFVNIGHELARGQRVLVHIRQKFVDHGRTFVPFLAKTVGEPISILTLRVTFPPDDVPSKVYRRHESAATPSSQTLWSEEAEVDPGTRTATYEVARPKLGHRYLIEWNWPDAQPRISQPPESMGEPLGTVVEGTDPASKGAATLDSIDSRRS